MTIPIPPASFVGRAQELAEVSRLLRRARLLTLVGPGGSGKTRLALELLKKRRARPATTAWWVDLTPIRDPTLIPTVIAQAAGLPEAKEQGALDLLVAELGDSHAILLLDNCEHLVADTARVVEALLSRSPGLRIVATSRETLRVRSETVFAVPPLSSDEAAALFVERARQRLPGFVNVANARKTIDAICLRLDRMPLAIELAASRVALMSPEEILQRLEQRFDFLSPGIRDTSDHRQTLRSTVDWSYGLLDPDERRLFNQLCIFRGGFDLAAAESVGGPSTVETLGRLVDKSLVAVEPASGGPSRYSMLETLIDYGRERLRESGQLEAVRRAHCLYFLDRAERAFAERRRTGSADRLHQLDRDVDNLRAALQWAREADPCSGLRLVATMREVWFRIGQAEGLRWTRDFIQRCDEGGVERAWALAAAGNLGFTQLEHEAARRDLEAARELGAELDDLAVQGSVAWFLGVDRFLAEDYGAATGYLNESIRLHHTGGDAIGKSWAIASLGTVLLRQGKPAEAIGALSEALAVLTSLGDAWGAGFCLTYLGIASRSTGDTRAAERHFREALRWLAPIRDVTMVSLVLGGFAELAAGSDWPRALRLAAAATALRERHGGPFPRWFAAALADLRERGRRALGKAVADRELEAGTRLRAEDAMNLALGRAKSGIAASGPLSPRELEIARLVATGKPNLEIAEQLHLSRRTVENHVLHILNKLGLANRTQVATWMLGNDLSTR